MIENVLVLLVSLFGSTYAYSSSSDQAKDILESVSYEHAHQSIITKNEWNELQLDRLVSFLDRTSTSFGQWGLTQLLHPIDDQDEIASRQKIVSFLVENEEVLLKIQKQLALVREFESALFSYWDNNDEINNACEQFYYTLPLIKKYLNNSSNALNAGVAASGFNALRGLFFSLGLAGVIQEFNEWRMTDRYGFNLLRGIRRGLEGPLRQHSFELDVLKDHDPVVGYTFKDYVNAIFGSFGDRYSIFSKGYRMYPAVFGLQSHSDGFADFSMGKELAFIFASMQTVAYDYVWGVTLLAIGKSLLSMHDFLNHLQHRICGVASCCNAITDVRAVIAQYPFIGKKCGLTDKYDEQLSNVLKKLSSKRFASQRNYFYSRGHVLQTHAEMKKLKNLLVPLLQSVAFLDAYCSIAQLYKESQQQANSFCFAQFVPGYKPFIAYTGAWLPLLPYTKAVANDLFLGSLYAKKVIITGPNGGGKSVILRTAGISAVLAQSWGIVPAQCAQQTIFSTIKTVFVAHENLEQGLSTFTAAKKSMQELMPVIQKSNEQYHVLALVDEPYIGTVDDESAKRIYNFGKGVAQYPCTLMYIATHVKKPVQLAADTQGVFANYHVEIREKYKGEFERLFLLRQGPATWWFDDEDKRGRFVDWISVITDEQQVKNSVISIDVLSSLLYPNT